MSHAPHLLRLSLLALCTLSVAASAQELSWPHWRGPTRDGHAADGASPPLEWAEDHNIRWKVPLPGLGNSSPIVVGERIYLTTAIDLEAIPEGEQAGPQPGPPNGDHRHRFAVLALDRNSGEEIWRSTVLEDTPHEPGHATGSHASASIVTDGERLIAFFGSRGLHCLDMEGEVRWSRRFGEMQTLNFGEGASPALYRDRVLLQWDEEGQSFVAAFDRDRGDELWRTERSSGASWGTPLVAEVDGAAQVILTGSDSTWAYSVADGEPVWNCGGMSKNPVSSPLVADGIVYVMNSYRGTIVQAIELAGARGTLDPDTAPLWSDSTDATYVPPPIVAADCLYYLRDSRGLLVCRDATSGADHYRKRLAGLKNIHASPILAGGRLYLTSREGVTLVVAPGETFQSLAVNRLDDVFDATPAFVGDAIYLRGRSHLYCIAED